MEGLLDLPMELRRQACGNEVGMAMVAMTCRWAADHWRPIPSKRDNTLLYHAVAQDACNIVPMMKLRHSAWWFARCAILAWQNDCLSCWDAMIDRATRAVSNRVHRPVSTLLLCASNRDLLKSRTLCLIGVERVDIFYRRCQRYAAHCDDPDAYLHLGGEFRVDLLWKHRDMRQAQLEYSTCQPRPPLLSSA